MYYSFQVKKVLQEIIKLNKNIWLIGIDGCGGSGKTTFALELLKNLSGAYLVHMDDFYKPKKLRKEQNQNSGVGSFFDWKRLEEEVLKPYRVNRKINFRKYYWGLDSLSDWISIPSGFNIIIEGVYSTRKELAGYYDLKIWIECKKKTRLQRGIERDRLNMKEYWEKVWMKQEDEYLINHKPDLAAEIIINGNTI